MFLKDVYYLAQIWRNPKKPYHDIQTFQLKKLKSVVTHAYRYSPFYHEKLKKAGVSPDDITSLKDITLLPFVTKDELIHESKNTVARDIDPQKYRYITTSGSSGKKLKIIHSNDFISHLIALFYRIYYDWGVRPFKKISYIRYAPLNKTALYDSTEKYVFQKLGIAQSFYISTFLDPEKQLELLLQQNSNILVGHPPDLVQLAKTARKTGVNMKFEFIGSNSELLTGKERKFIEETFGCPVYDEYSTLEIGYIARDCRKKNMHIVSDSVIVEFIKDGEPVSPGEHGEVTVTSLFGNTMPFIRYKQGDIASAFDSSSGEECDCGITFPLMNVIKGRKDDFLLLPSGARVAPTRVIPIFFKFDSIREFNVIQTAPDTIIVNVVPDGSFEKDEENNLLTLIKDELPGMDITLQYVDSIEKSARGKKRAVINQVTSTG
jgi:phenylacetate-CoA ligase